MSSSRLKTSDHLWIPPVRFLIGALMRLLAWSIKIEFQGFEEMYAVVISGRPVIVATWHGNILALLLAKLKKPEFPGLITLVSRSRDGEIATRLIEQFDVIFARGSSSKGGAAGLLEFQRKMKHRAGQGIPSVGFQFLDGPRGPRHKAKPGTILLARLTDAVVIPIEVETTRVWTTGSWDRHRIPKPFSRLIIHIGAPLDFTGEAFSGPEASSRAVARLEKELLSLEK